MGAPPTDEEMQDSTGGAGVAKEKPPNKSSPRKALLRSPQEKPPNPHAAKISRDDDGGRQLGFDAAA